MTCRAPPMLGSVAPFRFNKLLTMYMQTVLLVSLWVSPNFSIMSWTSRLSGLDFAQATREEGSLIANSGPAKSRNLLRTDKYSFLVVSFLYLNNLSTAGSFRM